MTVLHAGGKFGGSGYKVSGGLHGVGMSVVNALSEWLTVEVRRNGHVYSQSYRRGDPLAPVSITGDCPASVTGTKQTYLADSEIFDSVDYNYETIAARMRELAF